MTIDAHGNVHDRTGQFASKRNSAPTGVLTAEEKPELAASIRTYLDEYAAAEEAYSTAVEDNSGGGYDDMEAYEAWEDFQTDNSGRAVAMLEEALTEIERLRAAAPADEPPRGNLSHIRARIARFREEEGRLVQETLRSLCESVPGAKSMRAMHGGKLDPVFSDARGNMIVVDPAHLARIRRQLSDEGVKGVITL